VRLDIVDVSGRQVITVVDAHVGAGPSEWTWNGLDASGARTAAGVYFARLRTPAGLYARRIVKLQ
jgi:flagellar hook assembly protein FlgD